MRVQLGFKHPLKQAVEAERGGGLIKRSVLRHLSSYLNDNILLNKVHPFYHAIILVKTDSTMNYRSHKNTYFIFTTTFYLHRAITKITEICFNVSWSVVILLSVSCTPLLHFASLGTNVQRCQEQGNEVEKKDHSLHCGACSLVLLP